MCSLLPVSATMRNARNDMARTNPFLQLAPRICEFMRYGKLQIRGSREFSKRKKHRMMNSYQFFAMSSTRSLPKKQTLSASDANH